MRRLRLLLICVFGLNAVGGDLPRPSVSRVSPLGGQRGTTIDLEILGEYLSNVRAVEFDCQDVVWTQTLAASSGKLRGELTIASDASLGPHLLRVLTAEGYSESAMFNVGQFPDLRETEPNDRQNQAQEIPHLPLGVHGVLEGAADMDFYAMEVQAGQRWSMDLRSIEYGSALEAKMFLLDRRGRLVRFNDDRNDYLETPFIEHTFEQGGTYYIKVDQYRGPRGFNFGKSSTYTLRITALPTIAYGSPVGAVIGSKTRISLGGSGLDAVEEVYLTAIRSAEYTRMTYPYTIPIRFREDPLRAGQVPRINGCVIRRTADVVEAEFAIPADSEAGLWRVWASGTQGIADGPTIELATHPDFSESDAWQADWRQGTYAINGALGTPGEDDVFAIHMRAGTPLHFWTLATQLGVPHLDPVLTLRDASGKRIAESDDIVAGQGTLLGNPDSSLFYTPQEDGVLFLVVSDRTARGGPSYQYRLKVASERPGFQLFTTPENVTVPRGGAAEIKVHLVREKGFEGPVSVWFEGMPPEVEAPRGRFRADQLFEPNADGADMIIPEITFRLAAPESLPSGTYPIRVLGAATGEEQSPERRLVEGRSTLIQGPLLDLWNFVRRPLPQIEMTVVDRWEARLSSESRELTLPQGGHATLQLTAENLPAHAEMHVKGLPPGVAFEVSRQDDQFTVRLDANIEATLGSFDISAEAQVFDRWVPSGVIALTIKAPSRLRASR